jgi:ABC-type Fe3+ transport system substrate-binding protein
MAELREDAMPSTSRSFAPMSWRAAMWIVLPLVTILAAGVLTDAQAASDWKARWDSTVAAAKKEGKVVVWGPGGSAIRRAQDAFEKEYPGITVEFSGGRGTSEAAKLLAQREGGLYMVDVFINGPTTANFNLKPFKALDPIDSVLILPEVTEGKNWMGGAIEYSDVENKYNIVFFTQVAPELAYNPKLVKPQEINSFQELLAPKWKGKVTINDPSVTGAGVPWFRRLWLELGPQKAEAFYRGIAAQAGPMTRDTRVQVEWVAQGKVAILVAPSTSAYQQLREKGVPLGVLKEFEGVKVITGSSTGTVSLVNRAPNPNAAAVYINWLLSKKGQTVWQNAVNVASRRIDIDKSKRLVAESAPDPKKSYWPSYTEENQTRTDKEEKLIKELVGR